MSVVQPNVFDRISEPPPDPSHVSPLKIFEIIRERWMVIGLVTALFALPALAFILTLPAYYDASSSLMIGTRQAEFRDLQATQGALDVDAVAINTEVGIIKSQSIAKAVVERLKLVDDPYFRTQMEKKSLKTRIVGWLSRMTGSASQEKQLSASEKLQVVRDLLGRNVTILNDGRSYLITVSVRTGRPDLSANIANAFADVYLDFKRHMKIASTWRSNSLLDEQIIPLRERLRKAEQAVEHYREKNGLISAEITHSGSPNAPTGVTVTDQQLVETNRALVAAQADLTAKRARANQLTGSVGSTTDVLSSPIIQQLRAQEAMLNARVASLASTAGDANPDLQAARAAAAHVRAQIEQVTAQITTSTDKDLRSAERRVAALTDEVTKLQEHVGRENEANVTLQQLESEAAAARAVYQDFLGRYAQTSSAAALQEPEAELISRADQPLGVSGPHRMQFMAIAILFSALVGVGVAIGQERMQKGVKQETEIDSVPGLFTLGMIPSFSRPLSELYRSHQPSVYMESVEAIRTILSFGRSRFRAKTITVTSSGPEEGKTVFALSLAANTGRAGKKALILDCDTRGPSALETARMSGKGKADKNQVATLDQNGLSRDVLPGVDVMTMSNWKSSGDQMIAPEVIQVVLSELSPHYDLIILDTPPLLAFPDAAVLSHETDGVVLIVKWGTTTKENLKGAMRQLEAYDARTLGAVLTQVPAGNASGLSGAALQVYRHYGLLAS
ncbi:GumC family protein [Acetobacter sp.]|uniref:GumC family protein n=1 Tax=Acetobacter sp. TaxID=440 RepID=UPI0025C55A34|nr:polysaccharide biosynthesis tyrosine autokinase [Acetobacter sp.]MCH4090400.1 polysaccharide biosynthesis tyrosine autokinase [Acetobacter sp.]MCI1299094.1 polysaccharide biosynthesis tyrosine autokinase [Acetobacter sp.]MCI1315641.1 polysaccharide biosynthesis tyrosine autokinase [Acetobacter sp.]